MKVNMKQYLESRTPRRANITGYLRAPRVVKIVKDYNGIRVWETDDEKGLLVYEFTPDMTDKIEDMWEKIKERYRRSGQWNIYKDKMEKKKKYIEE